MTRRLTLACLAMLSLAACGERSASRSADATHETTVETEAPVEPAVTLIPTGSANTDFDQRAFAGTFSGTLPCASCPGIDTTLQLQADGSYTLAEQYQEQEDGAFTSEGTWTAEADGARIRLDPGSKSEDDRVYAIRDGDRLVQLDAQGQPAADGLDHALIRTEPPAR